MGTISGKTALITGAAGAIGSAGATVFAAHGAQLVLVDIDEEAGTRVAREVNESGGSAMFVCADVTSESDVVSAIEAAVTRFGRLDCAFNNAGVDGAVASFEKQSQEAWDSVMAVNLTGVWLCMKHQIRLMLDQGDGAIVNTSSVAGLVGLGAGMAPYVAAKHGVVGLTRAAALEFADKGLRINAICPGPVRTPMLDSLLENGSITLEETVAMTPSRRLAEPSEIAEVAVWLCSEAASYITGSPFAVDGGMTAGLSSRH